MKKVASYARSFVLFMTNGAAMVTLGLTILLAVLVTLNTVLRYGFDWAFIFMDEYGGYALVAIAFLALAYADTQRSHIKIDLVVRHLPERTRAILEIATLFLALFTIIAVSWILIKDLVILSFINKTLGGFTSITPVWIPQSVVALGFTIFVLEIVLHIAEEICNFPKGSRNKDKSED